MAGSVNKVILVGNLGGDPEIRAFQSGGRVANFNIATSESWKDKATGERKEKTQWHRVVVKNENLIGICEKYIKKGSKVFVEGQIENRKYTDKDGAEKYVTEIIVGPFRGEITMLDSRSGSGSGAANDYSEEPAAVAAGGSGGSFGASGKNDMDDEIPF
jgi:single-strand DNA-binding protein